MNPDKTQILQIEKNTSDVDNTNRRMISITDGEGNNVTAKINMKILGFTMNARGNMESHLAKVKSKIGMELTKLKPQLKYMTLDDRKMILNAKLKSIMDYGMPLLMGENESVL